MLNINNMIEVILLTGTPSFITKNCVPSTGSNPYTGHTAATPRVFLVHNYDSNQLLQLNNHAGAS